MRWIGRSLTILLMLAVAVASVSWFWQTGLVQLLRYKTSEDMASTTSSSIVYPLGKNEQWLTFELGRYFDDFVILSNAALKSNMNPKQIDFINYQLRYEVVDDSGKKMIEKSYAHRTHAPIYRDLATGNNTYSRFYSDSNRYIAPAQKIEFQPMIAEKHQRLRIRLQSSDTAVDHVALRVYARRYRDDDEKASTWQRLSEAKKVDLSEDHIYGHEFMTQSERKFAMRYEWQPLGPIGIPERDYQQEVLYQVDAVEARPDTTHVLSDANLICGPMQRAVVPLNEAGRVTFSVSSKHVRELESIYNDSDSDGSVAIRWRWYGEALRDFDTDYRVYRANTEIALGNFRSGVLEFECDHTVEIEAVSLFVVESDTDAMVSPDNPRDNNYREKVNGERHESHGIHKSHGSQASGDLVLRKKDLLPEPRYVRLYQLTPNEGIEFVLDHEMRPAHRIYSETQPSSEKALPTPLRIDVRLLSPFNRDPQQNQRSQHQSRLNYEFLSENNDLIKRGHMMVDQPLSLYERLKERAVQQTTTDKQSFYFLVPPKATKIRISASKPALLSAYTRPIDFVQTVQVPEDYRVWQDNDDSLNTWFRLKSVNHDRWIRDKKTTLVSIQSRPPDRDFDTWEGDYTWEQFEPTSFAVSRYILLPDRLKTRQRVVAPREEALGSYYRQLPTEEPLSMDFQAKLSGESIRPGLIYLSAGLDHSSSQLGNSSVTNSPRRRPSASFSLYQGKQLWLKDQVAGSLGERRLPPVTKGQTSVRLDATEPHLAESHLTQPYSWYMNQSVLTSQDLAQSGWLQKKYVHLIDDQPMLFNYEKSEQAAQTLSFEVFFTDRQVTNGRDDPVIHVRLQAPFSEALGVGGWTLRKRDYHFNLTNDKDEPIGFVLQNTQERIWARARFYFTLASDLAPGRYPIEITTKAQGYVMVYRVQPGKQTQHRVINYSK